MPLLRGVALLPTRPCRVGVLGVVFKIDDIDPSADRFTGDEYTIFGGFGRDLVIEEGELTVRESKDGTLLIDVSNNLKLK